MCGIAGLVWKCENARRVADFRTAAGLMAHRGPDSYGEFIDERVLLIHYRLAIIDLSSTGNQPFEVVDGQRSVGVYNGELYNFREIAASHVRDARGTSDTEVLFKGIHQNGDSIIKEYNGIFAFAQYYPEDAKLLLARDRFGVKPLYLVDTADYFAFASEAKVLYAFQEAISVNPRVLHEYLRFGSSMSMDTMVAGVRKAVPGNLLRLDLNTWSSDTRRFWTVDGQRPRDVSTPSYDEAKAETTRLLAEAVERQCLSDVPIGAYLSGGIDSSIVVALAAQRSGQPINTYSVQFEGSENTELPLARLVAERYCTTHHEMEIATRDLEADIAGLVIQYDEPFADPAALPLHLMAAKCAPITKVILQGDGGDELFAGYGRHLDLSEYRKRRLLFGLLSKVHPKTATRARFAARYHALAAEPLARRLAELTRSSYGLQINQVLKDPLKSDVLAANPLTVFEASATKLHAHDRVGQMLLTDMEAILPHTFLEKVDKVSMWHSVEARVPMLDNDLADYVTALPSHYKIRERRTKALLRDIASDLLPEAVAMGRKQSFGTPMGVWLRTFLADYVTSVLQTSRIRWDRWFDFEHIEQLHREHIERKRDHSAMLWRVVVLLVWLNHYQDKIPDIEPASRVSSMNRI